MNAVLLFVVLVDVLYSTRAVSRSRESSNKQHHPLQLSTASTLLFAAPGFRRYLLAAAPDPFQGARR